MISYRNHSRIAVALLSCMLITSSAQASLASIAAAFFFMSKIRNMAKIRTYEGESEDLSQLITDRIDGIAQCTAAGLDAVKARLPFLGKTPSRNDELNSNYFSDNTIAGIQQGTSAILWIASFLVAERIFRAGITFLEKRSVEHHHHHHETAEVEQQ